MRSIIATKLPSGHENPNDLFRNTSPNHLSRRLADAFAWLYIGSATLKRFVEEGQQERDLPYAQWATQHALHEMQEAMLGTLRNLPMRWLGIALRPVLFPLGARYQEPSDRLGSKVARGLLEDGEARKHLTRDIYLPAPSELGLGRMEEALDRVVKAHAVKQKIRDAVKAKALEKRPKNTLNQRALEAGTITTEELALLAEAERVRAEVIAVDAFEAARDLEVRHSA